LMLMLKGLRSRAKSLGILIAMVFDCSILL
jgi:hypothetical protein